ncbi:MAG: hypothetical protein HYW78_00805 [Parcubacteria group bacterium]|nr:hypothetical protein [Parcubacteria group bacterium]
MAREKLFIKSIALIILIFGFIEGIMGIARGIAIDNDALWRIFSQENLFFTLGPYRYLIISGTIGNSLVLAISSAISMLALIFLNIGIEHLVYKIASYFVSGLLMINLFFTFEYYVWIGFFIAALAIYIREGHEIGRRRNFYEIFIVQCLVFFILLSTVLLGDLLRYTHLLKTIQGLF